MFLDEVKFGRFTTNNFAQINQYVIINIKLFTLQDARICYIYMFLSLYYIM